VKVEVRATGLRGRREAMGWTQRELAKQLGVTQNYIPALELGNRNPGPDLRQKLMELFKCDFEDLFSVVMVNPNNGAEQLMVRETRRSA
jgi:transcriptional regulator with XRE-family HTH domain